MSASTSGGRRGNLGVGGGKKEPPRPPSRTAPTAAHPRAPSPAAPSTSPAAGARSRTTAACGARSSTGRWAGTRIAAWRWRIGAWRRRKQPKQRRRKLAKEGRRRRRQRRQKMKKVAVVALAAAKEATRTTSAPSAWRTSTILSSALRRPSTARTASTGRAWRSCGKGRAAGVSDVPREAAGQRGEDVRRRDARYTSRSRGACSRAMDRGVR